MQATKLLVCIFIWSLTEERRFWLLSLAVVFSVPVSAPSVIAVRVDDGGGLTAGESVVCVVPSAVPIGCPAGGAVAVRVGVVTCRVE